MTVYTHMLFKQQPAKGNRAKPGLKIMYRIQESAGARILISVVIGLGIASLFRLTCKGRDCVVVQGPPLEQTRAHVYKIEDECYKYNAVPTPCKV